MAPLCRRNSKSQARATHPTLPTSQMGNNSRCRETGGRTRAGRATAPGPRAQLPGAQPGRHPPCGTGFVLYFSRVSSPWGVSERAPSLWAVALTVLSQPPGSLGPFPAAGEAQTASTVMPRGRLPVLPCGRGLRGSATRAGRWKRWHVARTSRPHQPYP